jgi:hypothetical protein
VNWTKTTQNETLKERIIALERDELKLLCIKSSDSSYLGKRNEAIIETVSNDPKKNKKDTDKLSKSISQLLMKKHGK